MSGVSLTDLLSRVDAYGKTVEDFRIKTWFGGAVSIVSFIIMGILFLSQLYTYLTPVLSDNVYVDTSRGHKLQININITVHSISCQYLSLDAMDTSGEQHLHLDHEIYKTRLDLNGNAIEEPKKEDISSGPKPKSDKCGSCYEAQSEKLGILCCNTCNDIINAYKKSNIKLPELNTFDQCKSNNTETAVETSTEHKCGSCYGAESEVLGIRCCNTCQDVKDAYMKRQWAAPNTETIEQCKYIMEHSEEVFGEGCQIYGQMKVNRVGGSFHIAPGQSFSLNHVHVHDIQPYTSTSFNTSHTINHLSFGVNIPGTTNPIDGVQKIATAGATMYHYYLKIVPTAFVDKEKNMIFTNQFSVTLYEKEDSGQTGMPPGIFFSYELSPIMVKLTETRRPFADFATNVCAIIGGVFTVSSIIDAIIYYSVKKYKEQFELGKAS